MTPAEAAYSGRNLRALAVHAGRRSPILPSPVSAERRQTGRRTPTPGVLGDTRAPAQSAGSRRAGDPNSKELTVFFAEARGGLRRG